MIYVDESEPDGGEFLFEGGPAAAGNRLLKRPGQNGRKKDAKDAIHQARGGEEKRDDLVPDFLLLAHARESELSALLPSLISYSV